MPTTTAPTRGRLDALGAHWPEYVCEAIELCLFMISAGFFTILLEYPSSPVRNAIADPFVRRMLIGVAMGSTAIAIVFSPLGKRSGAHFNPAVTLTFWRLGKVKGWDAFFYIIAQFLGGIAGVAIVALFSRAMLSHPTIKFVATLPGPHGAGIAFAGELVIAFLLMTVVLHVSNTPHLARFTGVFAGCLVATIYHFRGAALRHEHEPRANLRLGVRRTSLDGTLDLLHRTGYRDAVGGNALSPHQARGLLRKIPSSQQRTLHLQLPISRASKARL